MYSNLPVHVEWRRFYSSIYSSCIWVVFVLRKIEKNAFSPYKVSCVVRMRPHLVQFNYLPFSIFIAFYSNCDKFNVTGIRISAHFYFLCSASAEGLLLVLVVFHLMEKSETKHRPLKIHVKSSPSKCRKIRAKDFEYSSSALTLSFYCSLFERQSTS